MTVKINSLPPVPVVGKSNPVGPYRLITADLIFPGDVLAGGWAVSNVRAIFTGHRISLADGSWIDLPSGAQVKIIDQTRAAAMLRHPAGKGRSRR